MYNEFLTEAQQLYRDMEPYALAFVVNREQPSSGKPGDKAIIRKSGEISGWIGGGCTRGIVLKEASEAIEDGKPRLVRIKSKGAHNSSPGVKEYPMTCHSGGAVEIYIEPVMPRPHILILGKSHVAMALSRLSKQMNYHVEVIAAGADQVSFPDAHKISSGFKLVSEAVHPNTCIVVCTQGEQDEDALEQAIHSGASYLSFVSSRKKANAVFHQLRTRGITFDQLKKIKTPAGLDINAKLPEEVAISILAQIIEHIRMDQSQDSIQPDQNQKSTASLSANPNIFINPVCGIPVEKSSAKHVIRYEEKDYYFCCDGCKISFEKEPQKYAITT